MSFSTTFPISTPRLQISHLDPNNNSHCALIVPLMHSPAYVQHKPGAAKRTPDFDAAREALAVTQERMQKTGYGRYLVSLKNSTSPTSSPDSSENEDSEVNGDEEGPVEGNLQHIGIISVQLSRHAPTSSCSIAPTIPDIGFGFLPAHHGRGYATEASDALMQHYRNTRGHAKFCGMTLNSNEGAKGVFRRLGFSDRGERRVRGVVDGDGEGLVLSVWTIGVGSRESDLKGVGL
jgi:RimJ/RimL family protein N-acetyltransferase